MHQKETPERYSLPSQNLTRERERERKDGLSRLRYARPARASRHSARAAYAGESSVGDSRERERERETFFFCNTSRSRRFLDALDSFTCECAFRERRGVRVLGSSWAAKTAPANRNAETGGGVSSLARSAHRRASLRLAASSSSVTPSLHSQFCHVRLFRFRESASRAPVSTSLRYGVTISKLLCGTSHETLCFSSIQHFTSRISPFVQHAAFERA